MKEFRVKHGEHNSTVVASMIDDLKEWNNLYESEQEALIKDFIVKVGFDSSDDFKLSCNDSLGVGDTKTNNWNGQYNESDSSSFILSTNIGYETEKVTFIIEHYRVTPDSIIQVK